MANLSSVDFSTGVLSSATTGTVMTINAVAAVAGTPAAFAMTVQKSSVAFTVTPSSVASVTPSSVVSVTPSSALTVFVSSLTGGTVTSLSSGLVAIANGANTAAVKAANTAASTTDPALVVSISPNNTLSVAVSSVTVSSGNVAIINGANTAAVKASLTPAASTDPALVVAISPNSPLTAASASNSVFKIISIDGTNATNIKAASAQLFGAQLYNNGSSTIFLKLYNSSVAPTAGSSQFFLNIGIPPGLAINPKFTSILSSLGLGYTITGAIASTDTTAVTSNDLIGCIEYA